MRRQMALISLIILFASMFVPGLRAQSTAPVQYFYDDLGRLIMVVDQKGNMATYTYDAVGNLLSITRSALPANNGLAMINFNPQRGPAGTTVIIQGQGFSATPSSNTVQFNGTAAVVSAATTNQLTVTVPRAATTGPVSVAVGGATAQGGNFTVTLPTVVSISVTPVNPTIAAGLTQQFAAVGTLSDGSTQDLTTSVSWSSSNSSVATISNGTGNQGLATSVSQGTTVIVATLGTAGM
jgi:YD repeat-containing protein